MPHLCWQIPLFPLSGRVLHCHIIIWLGQPNHWHRIYTNTLKAYLTKTILLLYIILLWTYFSAVMKTSVMSNYSFWSIWHLSDVVTLFLTVEKWGLNLTELLFLLWECNQMPISLRTIISAFLWESGVKANFPTRCWLQLGRQTARWHLQVWKVRLCKTK